MSNIIIYKKPSVVLFSEENKLSLFSDAEQKNIAKNIIKKLIIVLAVGKESNFEHHKESVEFIYRNYGNYSPAEIRFAFELALTGTLGIDLYQQINCVVIGKVMSEYGKYKRNKLFEYNSKIKKQIEMQEDEKRKQEEKKTFDVMDATIKLFESFKATNKIEGIYIHIYDYLFSLDQLPKSKEYKDSMMYKAKAIAVHEAHTSKKSSSDIGRELLSIHSGQEKNRCIIIAKRLVLREYFQGLISMDIELKEII